MSAGSRYRTLERLGVGHVAEVCLAELEGAGGFRRLLVVKRLLEGLDDDRVTTFLEEASLVARLRHPNIVQVLDLVEDGESYTMALELVDGPSLESLVGYASGLGIRVPVALGAFVVREAAYGLSYAHEALDRDGRLLGVVHRDVRPANILVSREGEVKVSDFSIALSSSARWTRVDGTGYAAPEQVEGGPVDRRADVYALGVILWELAVGRRLFANPRDRQLEPLPPPSVVAGGAVVGEALDEIVARATAVNPDDRYETALELAGALTDWLGVPGRVAGRMALASWIKRSCPDLGPANLVPLAVRESSPLLSSTLPPPGPSTPLPARRPLIGREAELAAIDEAVKGTARVLLLRGPAGVGKTHLAVEWARARAERSDARTVFCDVRRATSTADVANLVVGQLSSGEVVPQADYDAAAAAHVLLAAEPTVLILDEVPRGLAGLDDMIGLWTLDIGDTVVLLTSHAALDTSSDFVLDVTPFEVPAETLEGPAAELFFSRLEAADTEHSPRWREAPHRGLVQRLIERVGGLPLGIVMAAARAADEAPEALGRSLASPMRPPPRATEDVAAEAVREVWNQCAPSERAVLLQLAMFQGAFSLDDAHAVVRSDEELAPTLNALAQRALLERTTDEYALPSRVRELCRALAEKTDLTDARERHRDRVLAQAEERLRGLRGPGAAQGFKALERIAPELRVVQAHAVASRDAETALRATLCLEPTFARRGDHRQLITMLELGAACGPEPALAARGAMAEARAHGWLFDFDPALAAGHRALEHAREAGDDRLIAEARSELAMVQVRCGQGDDAAKRYRDALAAMKKAGDRRGEGVVLLRLANLLSERDEGQAATMMYRLALEAIRHAEDQVYEGIILSNLGAQLLDEGRPDQAHQALYLSQEIFQLLGEERYGAVARGLVGVCVMLQGDWERGTKVVQQSVEVLRRVGERGVMVFFLGVLVGAHARLGDASAAQTAAAQMDALTAALEDTQVAHISTLRRGHLELLEAERALRSGDVAQAKAAIAGARARAKNAPRDVLTTLRIAAADLSDHCDAVEATAQGRRRSRTLSIGKLKLARVRKPSDEFQGPDT